MPAVAGESILGQLFGDDKGKAIVLPLSITASHGDDIGVAHLLQAFGRQSRSDAAGTVNNDGSFFVGNGLFDFDFQKPSRQKDRAGKMSFIPFILLAYIEQNEIIAMLDSVVH